jgi:hypothetical protein
VAWRGAILVLLSAHRKTFMSAFKLRSPLEGVERAGWWGVSESQARRVSGVAVARQQQVRAGATPLRVVSGSGQGQESRFWVTARGD